MKDITIDQIDEIKNNSKSIVLIYADGCEACSLAKPYFESIEPIFNQFYFYKLQFSPELLDFYNRYIPKEEVIEDEKIVLKSPIVFPNFMIFINQCIDENNEHGFVGNVGGLDTGYLEAALYNMTDKVVANG